MEACMRGKELEWYSEYSVKRWKGKKKLVEENRRSEIEEEGKKKEIERLERENKKEKERRCRRSVWNLDVDKKIVREKRIQERIKEKNKRSEDTFGKAKNIIILG